MFASRRGRARWPPPIMTVPLASCLKESLRARRITTGSMKAGTRLVIISIGAMTSSGTGSPSRSGDPIGPGAGRVDDLGRLERRRWSSRPARRRLAFEPGHAQRPHGTARRPRSPRAGTPAWCERDRRRRRGATTMPPGHASDTAGTRRFSSAGVDQLLVREAAHAQIVDAVAEAPQLLLRSRRPAPGRGFRKPQSSPTRLSMRSHSSIEATDSGISATCRASWRTPPALTPEAWRPA